MANYTKNMRNAVSEYLFKIQRIVTNSEFKNTEEAARYETMETKSAGGDYVRAVLGTDIFENYQYSNRYVYAVLEAAGYSDEKIMFYINNPSMIPNPIKTKMLQDARQIRIAKYVEGNKYYANLAGMPFVGNDTIPADAVIAIPDGFYEMFKNEQEISQNQPIHTLPKKYQELLMNSAYYPRLLRQFPNERYLRYIGSNAIPIEVSRPAKDGEIIRINTNKLSCYHKTFGHVTVASDIIHQFVNVYKQTRDYVYNTLRGNFNAVYANYNELMRFLTIYMAIGNTVTELMKKSSSMAFMNNTTANEYFMLYGLPSVIMEGPSMISFLKKFRMLLKDKGTNVVYRVKDLVGYEYTDIYTLIMVKQQVFENGYPIYVQDEDGNLVPKQRIVFRRLGTTDDNTSYFKFRESNQEYDWEDIASGDPRWWNTPETEQMLMDMNYTLSNSKYIQLSTHISMTDIFWQSVILLRGLLDSKNETQYTNIDIGYDLDGTTALSVFDAVLALVVIMNWHVNTVRDESLRGQLYLPNSTTGQCLDMLFNGLNDDGSPKDLVQGLPFKLTSFDFDLRSTKPNFYATLNEYDYLEPDVFIPMLDNILDRTRASVGEALMSDVKNLYDYLEKKLLASTTIHEFRQVTDAYHELFLVEPNRAWDTENLGTDQILMESFDLTQQELNQLKYFTSQLPDTIEIPYNDQVYTCTTDDIMNTNALEISFDDAGFLFHDNQFVAAYEEVMKTYHAQNIERAPLNNSIKSQYQSILSDKVLLDIGYSTNGVATFDSLLYRRNASLYRKLTSIRGDGESLILLMRAIIKGLESYTNSQLIGLEFSALGADDYFYILKEVITYFKSYMVEFTKEEFQYIMDGLFDYGGNSNMLRLYDEINDLLVEKQISESIALHDVSNSTMDQQFQDDNVGLIHDDMFVQGQSTFAYLKTLGNAIWFYDGNTITQNQPGMITDDTIVTYEFRDKNGTTLIIIDVTK